VAGGDSDRDSANSSRPRRLQVDPIPSKRGNLDLHSRREARALGELEAVRAQWQHDPAQIRHGGARPHRVNETLLVWLQLLGCAAVIMVAGAKLSRYGDVIADKTSISGSWIGLMLMASVTSLPELVTGISAVRGTSFRPASASS
jgi:Ca2+/Na+ antiporter